MYQIGYKVVRRNPDGHYVSSFMIDERLQAHYDLGYEVQAGTHLLDLGYGLLIYEEYSHARYFMDGDNYLLRVVYDTADLMPLPERRATSNFNTWEALHSGALMYDTWPYGTLMVSRLIPTEIIKNEIGGMP